MTATETADNRSAAGMDTLVTTVQQLSLARDMASVMEIVRHAARKLTGADGATFILKDGENCFYADEDAIEPLWKGHRFPMHSCVSGWAMIHKEAAIIPDIYDDGRVPVEAYRPTFVKTMVMVPVRRMDPIAAIGNYWAVQQTPTEEQVRLLQSLADITAVTIENINVYNELEKRVAVRTAELEASNKDLESFSFSVSHDLRAPLRAVKGYMDMIMEEHSEGMSDKGRELSQKVMLNAVNMYRTIDDLLAFFTAGKSELALRDASMDDIVTAICSRCLETEPSRDIDFVIKELHTSRSDAPMMQHVWSNIILNAVKYSRKKDRSIIEIGSGVSDDMVVYYVKDNGAGFDMKYYDQIFEVFKRLHSESQFEGNGIGLAIVQKVVARHGGTVWAESQVDEGSVFYFSLPKA